MFNVNQCSILLTALISEYFYLILQDFDAFLHLSQVLGRILDLRHVLISSIFHFFIECDEGIQSEFSLLLLFSQI